MNKVKFYFFYDEEEYQAYKPYILMLSVVCSISFVSSIANLYF